MNARERAKELAELFELHNNAYVAGVIRDLLAEIERLEEELKTQKLDAWNHEGTSRDYLLAMDKIKKRDEQIDALTRQRDRLTAGLREISKETECDGEWMPSNAAICARQALADAGMEEKK